MARLSKRPADQQALQSPIFVVGTGRCGSTLISNILRKHPDVLSLSEFFFSVGGRVALHSGKVTAAEFWKILSTPRPEITFALRQGLQIPEFLYAARPTHAPFPEDGIPPLLLVPLPHLTDEPEELFHRIRSFVLSMPPDDLPNQYLTLFHWMSEELGKTVWVERSGASLTHLLELLQFWPDAKFVHIFRDGRECAYSMSVHPGFRLLLSTLITGTPLSFLGSHHIPIQRFGYFWSWMIVRRARLLDKLSADRVLKLRYEDLVAEPVGQIGRLMQFVIPSFSDGKWLRDTAQIVRPEKPQWVDLPHDQREALNHACAPGLRALGYI